jgi:hypothetical protein
MDPSEQSAADLAAERVRAIVEAAEASARQIEQRANKEAERIRAEAGDDLRRAREAAERIAARAADLVSELDALLAELQAGRPAPARAPQPTEALPVEEIRAEPVEQPGPADAEPDVLDEVVDQTAGRPSEGARLIALNMALEGKPREETARYLRENFGLAAPDELLDEVYARAGS